MRNVDSWRQDLFDLMANANIELLVQGEMNEVDAALKKWDGKQYVEIASVVGAEDFDSAMRELLEKIAA